MEIKFFIFFMIIFVGTILGGTSLITYINENVYGNTYEKYYNEIRNETINEINSNTTISEKIKIIEFNCGKGNININRCKNDLSKEFIQDR